MTVPILYRPLSIYEISLEDGVPKGIGSSIFEHYGNQYLSIRNHESLLLEFSRLSLCSQMQTKANTGKAMPSTVPKKSRLFGRAGLRSASSLYPIISSALFKSILRNVRGNNGRV